MYIIDVNFLAVFVAAIINLVLGWIWYSPKLLGGFLYPQKELRHMEKEACKPWQYAACFVEAFILSWALAIFITAWNPPLAGAVIMGLILWFGFVNTTLFSSFLWGHLSFPMFLMNTLYSLTYIVIISLIIGAWL